MDKETIRLKIRTRKGLLSAEEKATAAANAFARMEESAAFILADRILMYNSLDDELSTRAFIDKWAQRKRFFLPRVNGVNLEILPYDKSRMHLGAFHIEEPSGDEITDISAIELIVVPAIAYDRRGNRVGRGKGFYDRLLTDSMATKIGVCYDFQLLDDEIEADTHDVPVDIIITDRRHIRIR